MSPPTTKAIKAAEALKKLDDAADEAQEGIKTAAEKAQKMIDDASASAIQALELNSRDKRRLNGSYNWDNGDRYHRGYDTQIPRLEDEIAEVSKKQQENSICAATTIAQVSELIRSGKDLRENFQQLRTEHTAAITDISNRMTTLREQVLQIQSTIVPIAELSDHVEALDKTAYLNKRVSQAVYVVFGSVIAAITYIVAYKLL